MTKATEITDCAQDDAAPTEPMRCTICGNLLGFYSERSDAELLLRCPKCSNDYNVTLKEGGSSYRRRSKRKAFSA